MIIFGNKFQKHISGYFNRYNFEKKFVNVKIIEIKIELSKYYYRQIYVSYWVGKVLTAFSTIIFNNRYVLVHTIP